MVKMSEILRAKAASPKAALTTEATRYRSLVVDRDSLPDCLEITAELADGTIMGLRIGIC